MDLERILGPVSPEVSRMGAYWRLDGSRYARNPALKRSPWNAEAVEGNRGEPNIVAIIGRNIQDCTLYTNIAQIFCRSSMVYLQDASIKEFKKVTRRYPRNLSPLGKGSKNPENPLSPNSVLLSLFENWFRRIGRCHSHMLALPKT